MLRPGSPRPHCGKAQRRQTHSNCHPEQMHAFPAPVHYENARDACRNARSSMRCLLKQLTGLVKDKVSQASQVCAKYDIVAARHPGRRHVCKHCTHGCGCRTATRLRGEEHGEQVRDDGRRLLPRDADAGRQRRRALQRPPPRVPARFTYDLGSGFQERHDSRICLSAPPITQGCESGVMAWIGLQLSWRCKRLLPLCGSELIFNRDALGYSTCDASDKDDINCRHAFSAGPPHCMRISYLRPGTH